MENTKVCYAFVDYELNGVVEPDCLLDTVLAAGDSYVAVPEDGQIFHRWDGDILTTQMPADSHQLPAELTGVVLLQGRLSWHSHSGSTASLFSERLSDRNCVNWPSDFGSPVSSLTLSSSVCNRELDINREPQKERVVRDVEGHVG